MKLKIIVRYAKDSISLKSLCLIISTKSNIAFSVYFHRQYYKRNYFFFFSIISACFSSSSLSRLKPPIPVNELSFIYRFFATFLSQESNITFYIVCFLWHVKCAIYITSQLFLSVCLSFLYFSLVHLICHILVNDRSIIYLPFSRNVCSPKWLFNMFKLHLQEIMLKVNFTISTIVCWFINHEGIKSIFF